MNKPIDFIESIKKAMELLDCIPDNNTYQNMKTQLKHTPGPWHYELLEGRYLVRDASELRIANINDVHTEDKQNAQLIAAAPDLLAACQFAIEDSDADEAFRRVKAAVLKATGGTL